MYKGKIYIYASMMYQVRLRYKGLAQETIDRVSWQYIAQNMMSFLVE